MSSLPPDPYKALGVAKDAKLPEIRSAHRKLVLKCHPDKVQDAALKAEKQDEFQKVQQAYELLSDDTRRTQYDELVKLFELRKEMGRGKPPVFEFEVRTAEPRGPIPRSKAQPQPSPKVYSHTPPRSWEHVDYEEPRAVPRKTASYDSSDRKRAAARDEERRRHEEDEKSRLRFEKEHKRSSHGEKKKSRDKDRKRGTEEKYSRAAYIEEESDDDYHKYSRSSEKKSSRRIEEEIRQREEAAREARAEAQRAHERSSIKAAPLDPKWDKHMDFAGQYMQAARRKAAPDEDDFRPGPPRRAETFAAPSSHIRHATPLSEDDSPRRSSAAREKSRKSSDTPPHRRDKDRSSKDRRSPPAQTRDPYIVEPPSPPPTTRKPTLQTYSSAPPNISPQYSVPIREKPSRSKTQDYPRKDTTPPSLPRAATFQSGDRSRERSSGGSRLKKNVEYDSDSSDSDSPAYATQRRSYSPPPRHAPEPVRYVVKESRAMPITSNHRSEMHNIDDEYSYNPRGRDESPRGGHRSKERPSVTRNPSSHDRPRAATRSNSQAYYTPDPPEPIIHTVRPSMPPRESSYRSSSRAVPASAQYFQDVKYAPTYTTANVKYGSQPPDIYRKADSGRNNDGYYAPYQKVH